MYSIISIGSIMFTYKNNWFSLSIVQLKHIFMVNCGANLNILEMLEPEEDVMFYIADR